MNGIVYTKIENISKDKHWVILENKSIFCADNGWKESETTPYIEYMAFKNFNDFRAEIELREKIRKSNYIAFEFRPVKVTREIKIKIE